MYAVIRVRDEFLPKFGGTDTHIEWLCLDEREQRWFLSEDKHRRWEFDLKVDAQNVIDDDFDGDAFLTPIPIAERPLSFSSYSYPSIELPIVR